MLVRRRKVRIEIEQQTVRVEVTSNAPGHPVAGPETDSQVEPAEASPPEIESGNESKKLKSGREP